VNQSDVHHISLSHWFYKGSGTKTTSSPSTLAPPQFPQLLPLPLWMGRTQLADRWRERRRIAPRSNWSPPRKKWREKGSLPGLSRYGNWFTYWYHWNQQWHGQHFLSVLTFLLLSLYSVVVDVTGILGRWRNWCMEKENLEASYKTTSVVSTIQVLKTKIKPKLKKHFSSN